MNEVCLGLGSNLGDRRANLRRTLELLAGHCRLIAVSSLYETEPVGYKDQGWFLNCAGRVDTDLEPRPLLEFLKSIEKQLGRASRIKSGPRTIDLDILFYGERVVQEEGLTVPHPRLHERLFVLAPLSEIAPALVHPLLGKTIRELADLLQSREQVKLFEPGT